MSVFLKIEFDMHFISTEITRNHNIAAKSVLAWEQCQWSHYASIVK